MLTSAIITLKYFSRLNSSGMHFTRFNFDFGKLIFICYNEISKMVDTVSENIVELLMNLQFMKLIGAVGFADFGVFSYVNEIFLLIFFTLSTTTVTLVGFNYGRNNFSEIRSLIKKIPSLQSFAAFFTGMERGSLSALIAFTQTLIMQMFFILVLPELFGANAIWFSKPLAILVTAILAARLLIKYFRRKNFAAS